MTQLSPTRMADRLPRTVTPSVRMLALASLISQILIVVTGGAVRLTASGLGCPEWPRCTADSMVTTAEMGIHGAIEFGNRLLTFVLTAIAVAMLKEPLKPVRIAAAVLIMAGLVAIRMA